MSAPTLSLLSSLESGWSISISSDVHIANVSYTVFSGFNIDTTTTENDFFIGTANLGDGSLANTTSLSATPKTYILNIPLPISKTLCAYDYTVILSTQDPDGNVSEMSDPLTLPLAPGPVTVTDSFITTATNPQPYYPDDSILTIYCNPVTCNLIGTDTIEYMVAAQLTLGYGANTQIFKTFVVSYDSSLNGIQVSLGDAYDECEFAVSAIRVNENGATVATGPLSDTFSAEDGSLPAAPVLTSIDYSYNASPPTAIINWNAGLGSDLTDVSSFKVYVQVNSGAYTVINQQPYVAGQTSYSYSFNTSSYANNTELTFRIESLNSNGERISNTDSIIIIIPSSAPQNLSAAAVSNTSTSKADVNVIFTPPSSVGGITTGAYFRVQLNTINNVVNVTRDVSYNVYQGSYSVFFNDISAPNEGNLNISVYLVTFQEDNTPINGTIANISINYGPLPLIVDINGVGGTQWTLTNQLNSLNVYSSTVLTGASVSLYNPTSKETTTQMIAIPTVTTPGSYYTWEGTYVYNFNSFSTLPLLGRVIIGFTVSNSSGFSQKTITGAISN
jgi:hypothetical protein